MKMIDLTDKIFGRLKVESLVRNKKWNRPRWKCVCDCGKTISVLANSLIMGKTKSCGSHHTGNPKHNNARVGMVSAEYRTWFSMKARCLNPKESHYRSYGGRGIKVCKRWMKFENFLEDMGKKPTPQHSIDRWPDNDGDYEPGNCRWATPVQQQNNTRRTVFFSHGEFFMPAMEASRMFNVSINKIYHSIRNGGVITPELKSRLDAVRKEIEEL